MIVAWRDCCANPNFRIEGSECDSVFLFWGKDSRSRANQVFIQVRNLRDLDISEKNIWISEETDVKICGSPSPKGTAVPALQ